MQACRRSCSRAAFIGVDRLILIRVFHLFMNIRRQGHFPDGIDDVQQLIQTAIDLEFSTLPPYLYAKFTILPGTNEVALARLNAIIGQEMIHMCLACNILNAVGGTPAINPPHYPGPLPGGVDGGVVTHLLPFSPEAMAQGMAIEEPSEAIKPRLRLLAGASDRVTIGEFYHRLDGELAKLPSTAWSANSIQFGDAQFFQGQLFAVKNYSDAHSAIGQCCQPFGRFFNLRE